MHEHTHVCICMYACICESTFVHACLLCACMHQCKNKLATSSTYSRVHWAILHSLNRCLCIPDYLSVPAQTLTHSLRPTGPVEDNQHRRRNEGGGEVEYIHIHTTPTESVYNGGGGEVEVEIENAHIMT